MDVIDGLRRDHALIAEAGEVLARLARRTARGDDSRGDDKLWQEWARLLDFLHWFADRWHHHKEEWLLFPAMENAGLHLDRAPMASLRREHRSSRAFVEVMATALTDAPHDPSARALLVAHARDYARLLREHALREDFGLLRWAAQVLDGPTRARLSEAVAAYEAGIDAETPGLRQRVVDGMPRLRAPRKPRTSGTKAR